MSVVYILFFDEMFSTKEYIAKKTGPFGVGRLQYLQELVDEFQSTDSEGIEEIVVIHRVGAPGDP